MTKKMSYAAQVSEKETPQTQPIPGSKQVPNSAGGFSFEVDDWKKLDRFLILGTEGGSYYASEKDLTVQNAEAVLRCVQADGLRTVARIVEVSDQGLAPKNDPAIFALGMCLKKGDLKTRKAAEAAVPKVCRIGTHVFQLAEAIQAFGGWGRVTKRAIANWYLGQKAGGLATNLVKYQQRNGWAHKDLIRKAHVSTEEGSVHDTLFRWVARDGEVSTAREVTRFGKDWKAGQKLRTDQYKAQAKEKLPPVIEGFEKAKTAQSPQEVVKLITDYNLPRECIPTQFLNDVHVWEALLKGGKGMPFTAMIRNLGKMSEIGLISPMSDGEKFVVARLADGEGLKSARVHPLQILLAQSVYAGGHGLRGSLAWTVSQKVIDALNEAFYLSFKFVEPTGKRRLIGLDVSGSMSSGNVSGTPLTPREAACALSLVTARTEQDWHIMAFSRGFIPVDISPKERLDDVVRKTAALPFEGTDCSLPVLYALEKKIPVDAFEVYTDSETYAGRMHPKQALDQYRQKTGIPAKLVVVGLVSNGFSIADPNDAGMMDVVGFDSSAPQLMANFIRE